MFAYTLTFGIENEDGEVVVRHRFRADGHALAVGMAATIMDDEAHDWGATDLFDARLTCGGQEIDLAAAGMPLAA